jgi:DNA polymerase III sliding clamp (beta) subunit (PCNA family)
MREAIAKVKDLVAKKDIIPILTHYVVKGGRVFACNDIITASAPIAMDFDMCVKAVDFQKFLDKTSGDVKLAEHTNHWIKISCGRFRAQIPGMDPKLAPNWEASKGKPIKLPEDLKDKLAAIRPFISDNATQPWSNYACIANGYIYATNNIVLARAKMPIKDADFMLSAELVDYILKRDDSPTYLVTDDKSLTFGWKDKTWLSQRHLNYKYPSQAFTLLDQVDKATWAITAEWREALEQLGELVDGEIAIFADHISSMQSTAVVEVDIESPVPAEKDHSSWHTKFIAPILETASHITIFISGGGPKMSFKNSIVEGVCFGMRK